MTVRDFFNRRLRVVVPALYAGGALFAAGVLLTQAFGQLALIVIAITGWVIGFTALILASYVWLRCPVCRGNLAGLLMMHRWPWRHTVAGRIRFCPYCGVGMDEEVPAKEPASMTVRSS